MSEKIYHPGGLGPFSRARAQFLPIRTSYPVNNIYIMVLMTLPTSLVFPDKLCLINGLNIWHKISPLILLVNPGSGDYCLMTGYSGNFQASRLKEAKDICMLAGGTGLCKTM